MSKRRPSKSAAALRPPPAGPRADPTRPWLQRVFHNTYTRGRRRFALRGWSVKIQSGRRRRTFSLEARTRRGAAAEARLIQETLLAEGWEAVVREYGIHRGKASSKTQASYWKERLLLRKYPAPADGSRQREFSVHIRHAGTGWYFPLGTSDPESAASRSLEIYSQVIQHGWAAAAKSFSREVTLAFHWAYAPLLWTYTTLRTSNAESLPQPYRAAAVAKKRIPILLVEPDPGIRNALAQHINQQEGFCCRACATAAAPKRQAASLGAAFCLLNRDLDQAMGLEDSRQIGTLSNGLPAVCYGVHVDSEQLFGLTPGGATVYVLKRTAPESILEPVAHALAEGRVSADRILRSPETYFQRLLQGGAMEKASSRTAQLTQREQDVLNLMSRGYVDKEIAPALGISTWTVHEHAKRIFGKLRVHSRTEAALAYLQK
jgi:DNA-binding NarL/FixJ family response regulator